MEIWKDIVGYEGLYMVSNLGAIKSIAKGKTHRINIGLNGNKYKIKVKKPRREKILSPALSSKGYLFCVLRKNKIPKTVAISRIVAAAFIPNPENKPFINHINFTPIDNRVENLEWCTQIENMAHSRINKRWKYDYIRVTSVCKTCGKPIIHTPSIKRIYCSMECRVWIMSEKSLLNIRESKYKKIVQISPTTGNKKIWESITFAAKSIGCNPSEISNCITNRQKTCRGYIWEYFKH